MAKKAFFVRALNTSHSFYSINIKWLPLEKLFSKCDIIVVCCTKNKASQELIGANVLEKFSHGSILISISHRDVFDNSALLSTLKKRCDIRAWIDFDLRKDDERFLGLPNVHFSPHLAFYTEQTLTKRIDSCIDQLEEFFVF